MVDSGPRTLQKGQLTSLVSSLRELREFVTVDAVVRSVPTAMQHDKLKRK